MRIETLSGYHDTELVGVQSDNPAELSLVFVSSDGTHKTLTLQDCELFRIVDFVKQNVVSRIMLFRGEDVDENYVGEKLEWISMLSDTSSFLSKDRKVDIVRKIRKADYSLVVLEPSCGADVAALCSRIHES